MKRMLAWLLLAALLPALMGCAAPAQEPTDVPDVGMPNPIEEVEGSEAFAPYGLYIEAPAGAEEVQYSVISQEIAQIQFQLDGRAYTYRSSASTDDIAGVYETFDEVVLYDEASVHPIAVRTISGGAAGALANWEGEGVQYTLFTPDATDAKSFGAVASALPCAENR